MIVETRCIGCKKVCIMDNFRKFCSFSCYQKFRPKSGSSHPGWKGGVRKTYLGYISIKKPGHPCTPKGGNGYVLEHRFVMSEHLGRKLKNSEIVHHRNGIKTDNRIENLEITNRSTHSHYHALKQHSHITQELAPSTS